MEPTPLTILVVDDDPSVMLFITKVLTSAGHRVFPAATLEKAREILAAERIDLGICDLILPGADGSDIIKDVKAADASIYCVLISGYYNTSFENYKVLVGANEVVGKPVTQEMLHAIVRRGAEHRRNTEPAP
ncbi:MAG: response regulator [Bacteroidetes bacterium]|nr:response regulator [Bacteroidota bacterium]